MTCEEGCDPPTTCPARNSSHPQQDDPRRARYLDPRRMHRHARSRNPAVAAGGPGAVRARHHGAVGRAEDARHHSAGSPLPQRNINDVVSFFEQSAANTTFQLPVERRGVNFVLKHAAGAAPAAPAATSTILRHRREGAASSGTTARRHLQRPFHLAVRACASRWTRRFKFRIVQRCHGHAVQYADQDLETRLQRPST